MDERDDKVFTRRAVILGALQGGVTLGLIGRLYYLQVKSGEHYTMLSDQNRLHTDLIAPLRGQIFDRTGALLAGNKPIHQALFRRDFMLKETESTARDLKKLWQPVVHKTLTLLELSPEDTQNILQDAEDFFKHHPKSTPFTLKNLLSWEDVARLELHRGDLPGVRVAQGYERFYPHAETLCHILGHVGRVQDKDFQHLDDEAEHNPKAYVIKDLLKQHPHVRLGKSGIEKLYNDQLLGQPGLQNVEVNATRHIVRTLSEKPPQHGEDLTLSIDLPLQDATYTRLMEHHSASAVVMHVPSGAIVCAVSTPSYDTNLFTDKIPSHTWQDILNNPYTPLVSKFSQGQYAPGSVFKMPVVLAGLRSGAITPHTRFHCPGYYELNGHRFHCHTKYGHGSVNAYEAIVKSCDVFFYNMSLLCGADAIAEAARDFGLGEITSLNFPNEKTGLIPTKTWKERIKGKRWTPSETINMSIGQGYVLATPLQMCVMTARLAARGQKIEPYVTLPPAHHAPAIQGERTTCTIGARTFETMDVDPAHMDLIFQGMCGVMQPGGTGYNAHSLISGVDFAGKTGTSQVRRITMRDRTLGLHKNWPWHWRDHSVFVGFAPVHAPLYAVSVVVEHGGAGSRIAAPLGRDILTDALTMVGYPNSPIK